MKGTVYKSNGNFYLVKSDNGEILDCRIKGKLRIAGIKSTNPFVVGDNVELSRESEKS